MFLICLPAFSHQGIKTSDLGTMRSFGAFHSERWSGQILFHLPLLWASGSALTEWLPIVKSVLGLTINTHYAKPFFFFLHGHVTKRAHCFKLEMERSHGWKTGHINLAFQMCPFQSQNYSLSGSSQCRAVGLLKPHGFSGLSIWCGTFQRSDRIQLSRNVQMRLESWSSSEGKHNCTTWGKWPIFRVSPRSDPSSYPQTKCLPFWCVWRER